MRIQSNGIVKVETNDSSSFNAHFLVNNSESNSGVSLIGSGSSFSAGGWAAVTDAGIIRSSANSSNGLVLQAASGDMTFYVGGNPPAERLRITSDGYVITNGGVREFRGGRQYTITSTSTWTTLFTFSNANNNGFSMECGVSENNYTTMYRVAGTAKWNSVYFTADDAGDSNHAHSSDITFQLLNDSGTKRLQAKAVSYTTTRYLTVISIWCKSGYVTWS